MFGVLILVMVGTSAGASYWWRNKTASEIEKKLNDNVASLQKTVKDLDGKLAVEKAKNTESSDNEQTVCTPVAPSDSVIGNIKASITSGDTSALEGYMAATSVDVTLAGTKSYGEQTPILAVNDISTFLSDDLNSWDYNFSLPTATLNTYKQGSYAKYFPDIAVVGKATNKKVISFSFDCNAKIDTVFLAPSEDLLK